MLEKQELRQKISEARKKISTQEFNDKNKIILQKIIFFIQSLNKIIKFDNLGLYYPIDGEPDLREVMKQIVVPFALPKIKEQEMNFVKYKLGDKLISNSKNFKSPAAQSIVLPKLIIAPALAYSIKGYRLGFGVGHYDRYLAKRNNVIKVGVCFDDFLFEYLPIEQHDVRFDYIITDQVILKL